ncbi:MAG TPA: protein translocase subunit SecF [Treponemataceae bacterium]|nr:protein translocase subunit SecF [Treponemataceae bacterium]
MKKVIRFSKFFIPSAILSGAIIIAGFVMLFTTGINFGIDFRPGLIQEVRISKTAFDISYKGASSITIDTSAQGVDLVVSGLGSDKTTHSFGYINYKTVGEMVSAMNTVEGITAVARASSDTAASELFTSSAFSNVLTSSPLRVFYSDPSMETKIEDVRSALQSITDSSVKSVGNKTDNSFQIRVGDDGTDPDISKKIQSQVYELLSQKFGKDSIAIVKTDFVASQFSKSLASQVIILVLATLLLIWIYATIRFKWDFALGAVLAIVHDALIIVAVITFTQMEFNSITIAAILTIIGYSINDTIVVLDRVRENIQLVKVKKFSDILDLSQTEILSRTIITTVTTLLAVICLFLFTSGSMKDFASALIIGMVSGVYSTIFITGAFIALVRRNWKPSDEERKTQVKEFSEEVTE